ncbi:MAG TPA: SMP-30/gluconolactonase/LRE family protein [Mesorhizobium sp.]|jgi:sugar lactone lactonase YvrE|nr:SMP-30/gluconolactonase/LRE family protein [Mesorhizobium sp.]
MPEATVLSPVVCELGEGPSYDTRENKLFWFDIVNKKLLEQDFPDGTTVVHDLPEMASAIADVDQGRQVVFTETGLHLRDRRSGKLSLHQPIEADDPKTRSNDARVHPSGAFWVGTMAKEEGSAKGRIWWYRAGELKMLFDGVVIPNSICFSADGATAFFACSSAQKLWRVACDPETGLPHDEPQVFVDGREAEGFIDGSVIDADGVLWNARWGGSRVDAYDAQGKLLRSIKVPASQASCPAFVGPDAGRLAVTSAWKGMSEEARAKEPLAGQTFLLPLEVKGRFEPSVVL